MLAIASREKGDLEIRARSDDLGNFLARALAVQKNEA